MKTNLTEIFEKRKMVAEPTWITIHAGDEENGEVKLQMTYFNPRSEKVKNLYTKKYLPFAKLIEKGIFPKKRETEIFCDIFTEACIHGWTGIYDLDGNPIAFDKDVCKKAFLSEKAFFDCCVELASDPAIFFEYKENEEEAVEELGESLEPGSDTTEDTPDN